MSVVAVQSDPTRSQPKPGPRRGINRPSPLTQALDLQEIALRDCKADATAPHIRAALMRAWVDLQEIAMALRGQGKPKPVEARNATPKRKRTPVAPIAPIFPARSTSVEQPLLPANATASASG